MGIISVRDMALAFADRLARTFGQIQMNQPIICIAHRFSLSALRDVRLCSSGLLPPALPVAVTRLLGRWVGRLSTPTILSMRLIFNQ